MSVRPPLNRILDIVFELSRGNVNSDTDLPEIEVDHHHYELSSRGYIVEVLPRPATALSYYHYRRWGRFIAAGRSNIFSTLNVANRMASIHVGWILNCLSSTHDKFKYYSKYYRILILFVKWLMQTEAGLLIYSYSLMSHLANGSRWAWSRL